MRRRIVLALISPLALLPAGCAQIRETLHDVVPTITIGVYKDDGKGINIGLRIETPEQKPTTPANEDAHE